MVSASLQGEIVNVDVVREYLVSPHLAVRCTIKYGSANTGLNSSKCLRSLLELVEERFLTKKKRTAGSDQDVRRLEEGTGEEQKHFKECLREEAEFGEEREKYAEAIVPNKISQAATSKQNFQRGW